MLLCFVITKVHIPVVQMREIRLRDVYLPISIQLEDRVGFIFWAVHPREWPFY